MSNALNRTTETTGVYDTHTSIRDYCEFHGLHYALIPDSGRKIDEWETLAKLDGLFNDLPKTCQSVRYTSLTEGHDLSRQINALVTEYLFMVGSFKLPVNSTGTYANPHYCHSHELTEKARPLEHHVEKAISLPTVSQAELADRFGMSPQALSNWCARNDYALRDEWHEGKKRIGRSILASAGWDDYDIRELCRIVPNTPWETVKDWAHKYAKEDGWTVPEEPTETKWYGSTRE